MRNVSLPKALAECGDVKELAVPFGPCVYFLIKNDAVIYVGLAHRLITRIATHLNTGIDFDHVLFLPVSEDRLRDEEAYWIQLFQPPLNRILKRGRPRRRSIA